MAANHEYIIDSDEWLEYQELRRREAQRRRTPRRRVDIPALLVLLLFVAACGYVLYSRYFGATPVISIAPQRPATAPAMHPSPELLTALAIRAAQPAPDANNPAVSAPDDYQEHSKPSTRSAPPAAEPTAAPVVQFVPDVQPTNVPVSVDDGSRVAPEPPPVVSIESAPPEQPQTEHTKQNTRKAPGAK